MRAGSTLKRSIERLRPLLSNILSLPEIVLNLKRALSRYLVPLI
jgi:hypothetical protein